MKDVITTRHVRIMLRRDFYDFYNNWQKKEGICSKGKVTGNSGNKKNPILVGFCESEDSNI